MFMYEDFYLMGVDSISDFFTENDDTVWSETSYFNNNAVGGFNKNPVGGNHGSSHGTHHGGTSPSHNLGVDVNRGGANLNYQYKNGNAEVNAGATINKNGKVTDVGIGGKVDF